MIEEILLLSDPALIVDLKAVLRTANPHLVVTPIVERAQLDERCLGSLETVRLLSFGSDIIVPASVLARLGGGAYNFHPGPPTYPGRYPSTFFLYEGGKRFGSTVHVMVGKVDAGPINFVAWFEVPEGLDCVALNRLSFQSLMGLFVKLAPHLAFHDEPLSRSDDVWSGRTTTQQDFNDLCNLPSDVSEAEFKRRYRAIGEGPDHALEITLFGHRFHLDNHHAAPDVMIGGIKCET